MSIFELAAILLTLAAVLGFLNAKFLKLPTTIGIMLISLGFSLILILAGQFFPGIERMADSIIGQIDFNEALLKVMLSYLLFAGALHVDLSDLAKQKWVISLMATAGVIISTFLVGTAVFYLLPMFGIEMPYLYCLLFGSLISPTDPVAVLGILKKAGVSKSLETKITGESLFNDGIGVVVFLVLLEVATGDHAPTVGHISHLFLVEVVGGIAFGAAIGFIAYLLLKNVDNYQVEVLITLALVTGGYSLATYWHLSGPLAMVVSGLMIGNHGRALAMSDETRRHLDLFWELVDEVLNALLFALIGLELLLIDEAFTPNLILLGIVTIAVVLLGRLVAVSVPVTLLKPFRGFSQGAIPMLTWGGLRGGISVALALALPASAGREVFLVMTYIVVIFSIAVQGLTLKPLFEKLNRTQRPVAE